MRTRLATGVLAVAAVIGLAACGSGTQASSTEAATSVARSTDSSPTAPVAPPATTGPAPAPSLDIRVPGLPANDALPALALLATQLAPMKQPVVLQGPPLAPVPPAECDPNWSHPLAGVQGRVTAADLKLPQAKSGWTCNLKEVGHYGAIPGGFRVWRYTDVQGHTCAYYDSSFAGGPLALISLAGGPSDGVVVLDMDDPTHPKFVELLNNSLAMISPHESLNLNAKRGLLAADVGNAATLPGEMAIYGVQQDCRHPVLEGQLPTITGHESGFSPDGNTFWVAGGFGYIEAVDVTDPKHPKKIWQAPYYSHGLNFSSDGNTMYQTDTINGNLGLVDVSQIQARKPKPQVHDISRVTWPTVTIPQNTAPFTNGGHHYLLEFEEFDFRFNPLTVDDSPGAARILNIDDPGHPYIVSNIRLAVNMRYQHQAADADPSALPPNQLLGYAFHYCALPTRDDPQIAACSTLNSGLRIFNISDPAHPTEVAYFIAPPLAGHLLGLLPGDLAFSQPAFDPAHREVWYTDSESGFYALQLSPSVWSPTVQ